MTSSDELFDDDDIEESIDERIASYWKSYENSNINTILMNLEEIEEGHYEIDEYGKDGFVKLLSLTSEQIDRVDTDDFIEMMNSLPSLYMLYLLQHIKEVNEKYTFNLISTVSSNKSTNKSYEKFYKRNTLFEKMQVISRIFSSDRLKKLTDITASLDKEV
ncbi:type IVB secretion system protein IcmW [Piscirickettsia litoralis]|uniref:Uncharacterized protein n=1 Tax=Piscirickettsia litoralis TaxID=1891921 RepID=A0ABX3A6M3_9GAMM|nr:type IVB secretion system protein IcmW [Piscirickettsia litoralis]ODN43882.1 hypothetical protein BGC07_14530 [Piscirickettsia litoralis]